MPHVCTYTCIVKVCMYVQMHIHMKAKDALKCSEECDIPPVTYGLPEP